MAVILYVILDTLWQVYFFKWSLSSQENSSTLTVTDIQEFKVATYEKSVKMEMAIDETFKTIEEVGD
jgi:hypothetical protein